MKAPRLNDRPTDWMGNRLEYFIGAGASSFLGDLGGQDGPGKPFLYDFEPMETRWSATFGARYFLREFHAARASISYARVRGSDATTNYPNRRYRNLNFKSPIAQVCAQYEFHLLRPKTLPLAGARTTRVFDGNRIGIYSTVGAGLFYFNPKANFAGDWFKLQPLGTEGQGLEGGPDPYRRLSFTFPMGGGITYLLNWNYTIGLDVMYHWTLTDYIDDASGYYYDNDAIVAANGKLAGILANPSVLLDDVPDPDWYTANQPRGGSQSNDTYLFIQLTVAHSFTPAISNRPIKQQKGPKARTFISGKDKKKKVKSKKARGLNNKKIRNKKRKFKAPKLNFGKKRRSRSRIRTF